MNKPEVDQPRSGGRLPCGLRYPGPDTLGCASQLQALSRAVKQAYGVEASAVRITSRDNLGEAHLTVQGHTPGTRKEA